MSFKDKIVMGLDVDETLMNSKTRPVTRIDFNGSDVDGDASAWLNFLKKMTLYCNAHSISFITQIISAKKNANPDDTIEIISQFFHEYLHVLDKQGDPIAKPYHPLADSGRPAKFIVRRYTEENTQEDKLCLLGRFDGDVSVEERGELPPIHLCYRNKPGAGIVSKAWVLKGISEHFNEAVPPENMFMLDNSNFIFIDIAEGSEGTTPCYQAISAYELERLVYASKPERTMACEAIITECENRIITRVLEILKARKTAVVNIESQEAKPTDVTSSQGLLEHAPTFFQPAIRALKPEELEPLEKDDFGRQLQITNPGTNRIDKHAPCHLK